MSLKPPWKQKNPIMEKACPTYHKQTAPAKTVEMVEEADFSPEVKKEFVGNYEGVDGFQTTVVHLVHKSLGIIGVLVANYKEESDLMIFTLLPTAYAPIEYSLRGKSDSFGKGYGKVSRVRWTGV